MAKVQLIFLVISVFHLRFNPSVAKVYFVFDTVFKQTLKDLQLEWYTQEHCGFLVL